MPPFFSIGVTTYNRQQMLKECLNSILAQSFDDFEVIVGNDFVGDNLNSEKLGIDDPRIKIINHEKNLGEFGNMNYMLYASNGVYFTWLADDDAYSPTFLESGYKSIEKYGLLPCIYTSLSTSNNYPQKFEYVVSNGELFEGKVFLKHYLEKNFKLNGGCGLFKRDYLQEIGGIKKLGTGFGGGNGGPYSDNRLAIIAGLLEKVVYINVPLIFYRLHGASISTTSLDVDAYSSAQKDLLEESVKILKRKQLKSDYELNLFLLLKWFIKDYFIVMRRSNNLQWGKLINYLLFIWTYTKLLKEKRRKMIMIIIHSIYKMFIAMGKSKLRAILS